MYLSNNDIHRFLYFGYIPKSKERIKLPSWLKCLYEDENLFIAENRTERDLLTAGGNCLRELFHRIEVDTSRVHIVPLSGGLDSRAILAALLERGLKEHIITTTFGVPGTFDFDFGNSIAEYAGTTHISIDLNEVPLHKASLKKSLDADTSCTFVFDDYFNSLIQGRFGKEAVYWSGFMGGEIAGAHLPEMEIESWQRAKSCFIQNQKFVKTVDLYPKEFSPEFVVPDKELISKEKLSYYEQLDFSIRQPYYIFPTLIKEGYEFKFPFLDSKWIKFILSLPREYRIKKYLYKKIVKIIFPDFFSKPTTDDPGILKYIDAINRRGRMWFPKSKIWRAAKRINYIDFDEALRSRDDIVGLAKNAVAYLQSNNVVPWINLDTLWQCHQLRQAENGLAFSILISLYLHLSV